MALTKKTTILLQPELHERLVRLAEQKQSSIGELIRTAQAAMEQQQSESAEVQNIDESENESQDSAEDRLADGMPEGDTPDTGGDGQEVAGGLESNVPGTEEAEPAAGEPENLPPDLGQAQEAGDEPESLQEVENGADSLSVPQNQGD